LKHLKSDKKVIVIGVHTYWNPKAENIKFLQFCEVLKYISLHFTPSDAIIWGGDLNSKPYDNMVEYVIKGAEPSDERMEFKDNFVLKLVQEMYKEYELKIKQKFPWESLYVNYRRSLPEDE